MNPPAVAQPDPRKGNLQGRLPEDCFFPEDYHIERARRKLAGLSSPESMDAAIPKGFYSLFTTQYITLSQRH